METQAVFTCSKSTMETPEQCVKSVNNKDNDVVLKSLLLTLNRIHTLFWCFQC